MSTPIKREDIRKGDRVRRTVVNEYVAGADHRESGAPSESYELIERAIMLPTEPGHYIDGNEAWAYLAEDGTWNDVNDTNLPLAAVKSRAPFTRLSTVAAVSRELLREVRAAYSTDDPTYWGKLDALAAKWSAE